MNVQMPGLGLVVAARNLVDDRSPRGARRRRRMLAAAALVLFLSGFALALGFGSLLLTATVALLGIGSVVGALRLLRTPRPRAVLRECGLAGRKAATRVAARSSSSGRARKPRRRAPSVAERRREAYSLNADGVRCRRLGRRSLAAEKHLAALETLRELRDRRGEALTLNNLALAQADDDDGAALDHLEEALAILRELSDEQHEGQVIANLGFVHRRRGRDREAANCLRAALEKLHPDSGEYRRVEEQLRRAS